MEGTAPARTYRALLARETHGAGANKLRSETPEGCRRRVGKPRAFIPRLCAAGTDGFRRSVEPDHVALDDTRFFLRRSAPVPRLGLPGDDLLSCAGVSDCPLTEESALHNTLAIV